MRLLLVEDEEAIACPIRESLEEARYTVDWARDGVEALALAREREYAAIVLDLMLPDVDGWEVCETLRRRRDPTPILMLTARGALEDRIRGFELGADDYVTKPFSQKELVARMDAVLRRYRAGTEATRANELVRGGLRVDFAQRRVTMRGQHVALTPTEYNLLFQLVTNPGRVMTHRELLDKEWGDEYSEEVHYRKVYVGRLRTKRELDPGKPELILTARGVGYRFPAD